ncbi:alanine acetyltransferase [Actibacterium mucosum KCTC 23349]|uniref:[Ribosomal protein bS18]-alanine N-acetyltransferase n=1 Tax=Actibacterium mucosum KCTC 23349 TaxID=1454373 RepID=A0A037ZF02_9RHOB|nr:ribosomal protein S18-alanine N-acetyltransferase [Actibacterium mucosum]KAJ55050.1 alanine acetyltransferase [Actibacterium mucosum KCTC 23349]
MTPAEMAKLHAACFTTPRPWSADEFATLLTSDTVFALTEPNGFFLGRVVAGEAELLTIAVDPAHRRKGLGVKLVRGFLRDAAARSATEAFLEVAADNAAAIALYQKTGFAESGRRARYYQKPDGSRLDALILSASIA